MKIELKYPIQLKSECNATTHQIVNNFISTHFPRLQGIYDKFYVTPDALPFGLMRVSHARCYLLIMGDREIERVERESEKVTFHASEHSIRSIADAFQVI